jgi:uncharacterized repeat protein (TIGR01451 family)
VRERGTLSLPKSTRIKVILVIFIIAFSLISITPIGLSQPSWPSSWIQIDWDRNENGWMDDWRDVEYAFYQYDADYLYLKLQCYDLPGKKWGSKDGRYKWFIDLEGDMYYSGGNVYNAEYLLFVEDTDYDGSGEMYLIFESNGDGVFNEYEPWPPGNYADYKITDPNIGGWRIVAPNQIEMCIGWGYMGNPTSYKLFWSTDQQNPNLDQAPTTDRIDEEQPLLVHNVAAISQTPTPTIVNQGEHVTIEVVVENKGTQSESFNVTCYYNTTIIDTKRVSNLSAGQQETVVFDWDTTGVPPGNYSIKAWADSGSEITETDETDNWCTSQTIVEIQPALVHDIAAISQEPDKWSAIQGEIVTINVTVSNLGDFSETFNVTCYYDNTVISYQTVTGLASKTSTSILFTWNTSQVPPDTYYIMAFADSSNVIDEIDEDNNNCTTLQAITIYSPSQMGNLYVDKVKTAVISGEDPPIVGLPTVYELTIIVTNTGGSDVSNIIVNETISPDVTFVSVGTPGQGTVTQVPPPQLVWDVGTLSPGQNATLTFRIEIVPPSLGTFYLNHKEDITATGTDTLTGDPVSDTGKTDITVHPIIRDVAAISQTPSTTEASQGDTVTIYVIVKNLGNVSETFNVTCYYNTNKIDTIRVHNLGEGDQVTILFSWDTTGVPPSTYSISAKADSDNEIQETNETNNLCTAPATVKIVIHDIAIISQSPSPTQVTQGEIVTIEVVVKNEGTEPENFTVSCYYNDTLLEIKTVTNLEPNMTLTLNFVWNTTGEAPGIYYINTQSSPVPGEKDTDDNACLSVNMVTILLLQYQITVTASPPEAIGGTFKVSYTKKGILYVNVTQTTPWTEMVDADTYVTVTDPQEIINNQFKFSHYNPSSSLLMDSNKTITLVYTQIPELSVSISPTTAKIKVGESVTFTSTVSGGESPYQYQWFLNKTAVSGATSSSWTFAPTSTGYYIVYLNVTDNLSNTAKSNEATVTVASPLTVTISPTSASILVGESVQFTSTVSGGYSPYTYQWYLNSDPVSGATSDTWTFTPTASGIYYVYLIVTDDNGNTAQSDTARVTVSTPTIPVGGYTVSISLPKRTPATPITAHIFLLVLCGMLLSLRKHKKE